MTRDTMVRSVRLYAHRGAAAELPENTLPSFARALELGADALETDVHLSRDGRVMVSHDPDGARTAGIHRRIRDCRLDELRTWNVGWGFGYRQRFEMPTLDEVLESFPDIIINIDLKQHRPSMVDEALAVIARHRADERVQIASFDLRTLIEVRRRGYRGLTALAPQEVASALLAPVLLSRIHGRGRLAQVPTRAELLRQPVGEIGLGRTLGSLVRDRLCPSNRFLVEQLRRSGARVEFWTVNDPDEARDLAQLGADGIMTDDPRRIAPALGKGPGAVSRESS